MIGITKMVVIMIMITYYYYCYVGGVGTTTVGDSLIVIGLRYQLVGMMGSLARTHTHTRLHVRCINRCFEVQAITTTTAAVAKLPTTVKCVGEHNNRLLTPTHTHAQDAMHASIHLHTHTRTHIRTHLYVYCPCLGDHKL